MGAFSMIDFVTHFKATPPNYLSYAFCMILA